MQHPQKKTIVIKNQNSTSTKSHPLIIQHPVNIPIPFTTHENSHEFPIPGAPDAQCPAAQPGVAQAVAIQEQLLMPRGDFAQKCRFFFKKVWFYY